MKKIVRVSAGCAGALCVMAAQANMPDPSPKELTQAVQTFLAAHGDLCMAKYTWPRAVTPEDRQNQTNDALQLPVLEKLGVAQATDGPEGVRQYSLTAKGRKYYLRKKNTTLGIHGQHEEHDADFCVAHLTLDRVVKWTPPETAHDHTETVVRYTYHIKAADWMSDPDAQRVFPIVDRVVRGEGKSLMTATVQWQDGLWVPVMPGE